MADLAKRKSMWKTVKHSIVGSKKDRSKKREDIEAPTSDMPVGIVPRNSIDRSSGLKEQIKKLRFDEFETSNDDDHHSPQPAEPGNFDMEENGGEDAFEEVMSRPQTTPTRHALPLAVATPNTGAFSMETSLHEDEGVAKEPHDSTTGKAGQYPQPPGIVASSLKTPGGWSESRAPKRTPASTGMKAMGKSPIGSMTQQNKIARREKQTPSTSSVIHQLTEVDREEEAETVVDAPVPGTPEEPTGPVTLTDVMATPRVSLPGVNSNRKHQKSPGSGDTPSSPERMGLLAHGDGTEEVPSNFDMNSDEFHMKLNPNHVHVSHRGQVDHEEHHVVGGEQVSRGAGDTSGGSVFDYAASGGRGKGRNKPSSSSRGGARTPSPTKVTSGGRGSDPASPGFITSPGPGSPEDQVIVMNMERQRALDREAQALALYSMQMRELLENQQGMYPSFDMNPHPPPPVAVAPPPVQMPPPQQYQQMSMPSQQQQQQLVSGMPASAVQHIPAPFPQTVHNVVDNRTVDSSHHDTANNTTNNVTSNVDNSVHTETVQNDSSHHDTITNVTNVTYAAPAPAYIKEHHTHHDHHAHTKLHKIIHSRSDHSDEGAHPPAAPLPVFHVTDLPDVRVGVDHSISKAQRLEKRLDHLINELQPPTGEMLDNEVLEHLNSIHSFLLKSHIARGAEKVENESLLQNIRLLADRCKSLAITNVATNNVAKKLANRVETLSEEKEAMAEMLKKDRATLLDRCMIHKGKEEMQRLMVEKLARDSEDKQVQIETLLAREQETSAKLKRVRGEHEEEVREQQEIVSKQEVRLLELAAENQALEEMVEEAQSHHEQHSEALISKHAIALDKAAKELAQAESNREFLAHEASAASKHVQLLLADKTRLASQLQDVNCENSILKMKLNELQEGLQEKKKALEQHSAALLSSGYLVSGILHQTQELCDELQPVKEKSTEFTSTCSLVKERLEKACEEATVVLRSTQSSTFPVMRDASSFLVDLKDLCKELDQTCKLVTSQARSGMERYQHMMATLTRTRAQLVSSRGREKALKDQMAMMKSTLEEELSTAKHSLGQELIDVNTKLEEWRSKHDTLHQEYQLTLARLEMSRIKNDELVAKMVVQNKEMTVMQQSHDQIRRMHAHSSSGLHLKTAELEQSLKAYMLLTKQHKDAQTLFGASQDTIRELEEKIAHLTVQLAQTEDKLEHSKAMTASSEHRRRSFDTESKRHEALMAGQMDRLALEKSIAQDLLAQQSQYCRKLEELRRHRAAWDRENQLKLEKVLEDGAAGMTALEDRLGDYQEEIEQLSDELFDTRLKAKSFGEGVLSMVKKLGAGLHGLARATLGTTDKGQSPSLGVDTQAAANEFMAALHNVDTSILELFAPTNDKEGEAKEGEGEGEGQATKWDWAFWQSVDGLSEEEVRSALQVHHEGLEEAKTWVCDVFANVDHTVATNEANMDELANILAVTNEKFSHCSQYLSIVRKELHELQEPLTLTQDRMHIAESKVANAYVEAQSALENSLLSLAGEVSPTGEELELLSRLRAGLGLVNQQADVYRKDLLKILTDMQMSTASRLKQEFALDKHIHSLDAAYREDTDLERELHVFDFLDDLSSDDNQVEGQEGDNTVLLGVKQKIKGLRKDGSAMSFGELMVKMLDAAERSLETEATHNLKLGECITREVQKRREAEGTVVDLKEALEEVTEEKKYLLHVRDHLEASMEGQDVHVDLLRRDRSSWESKTGDTPEVNLTVDVNSAELYSPQKARVLNRQLIQDKNELRNERILSARLQGQLDKTNNEYHSLQSEAAKMSTEVESLRADVVTLVEKLQRSESNLMTRTDMYENAMKKVEKLSLSAAGQGSRRSMAEGHGQGSRRSMAEGLLGKADVQIMAHTNLVKGAKGKKEKEMI